MEFLSNKPLLITDTILRDAHQSQAATRMTIEDMIPALEQLDSIGYYSLECWGGATFDACMRFLNEDPWERLRTIRKYVKNTKLQMLFRGQNILGYNRQDSRQTIQRHHITRSRVRRSGALQPEARCKVRGDQGAGSKV